MTPAGLADLLTIQLAKKFKLPKKKKEDEDEECDTTETKKPEVKHKPKK